MFWERFATSPPPDRCDATVGESDARTALLQRCDRAHVDVSHANREFLDVIHEIDRTKVWAGDGARDLAQWLCMRSRIAVLKARRLNETATALPRLPATARALDRGELGV